MHIATKYCGPNLFSQEVYLWIARNYLKTLHKTWDEKFSHNETYVTLIETVSYALIFNFFCATTLIYEYANFFLIILNTKSLSLNFQFYVSSM